MSLFGSGGVVIAGRHVSYGLLAVVLSVPVAGLAIYQFRQGGGVSVGSPASTGTPKDTGGDSGGGGGGDAALQNLGQEVSALMAGQHSNALGVQSLGQQVSSLSAFLRNTTPYSVPAMASIPAATDSTHYVTISKVLDITPSYTPPAYTPPAYNPAPLVAAAASVRSSIPWLAPAPPPPPPPPPPPYLYQQSPPVYTPPAQPANALAFVSPDGSGSI